jgi:hypothetical protein
VSEAEIEALRKSLSRKEEKAHEDTKDAEAADIQREADFKISLEMESREHDDDQNVPGS